MSTVPRTVPRQKGLAQARAGCDDGDRAPRRRRARAQGVEHSGLQAGNRERCRFEIVEQVDRAEPQRVLERFFLDHPRQVGEPRLSIDDRPCDVETGRDH